MAPVTNELEPTMRIQFSKSLHYLLLVTSLTVTINAQSGPLNRASELESTPMASEDRRQASKVIEVIEKKDHAKKDHAKKSHKKDSSKHFSKGHHSKKHHKQSHKNSQKNKHAYNHHKPKHGNNHHSKRRDDYSKWKNQHWGQKGYSQSISWRYAGEFQTRKHEKESDITIEINDDIKVVEIEGLGRGTVIHRAYLEIGDGRLKRLRELEGYVERRDVLQHRLRYHRYAHALHLEVSSSGRKRAFAKVSIGY